MLISLAGREGRSPSSPHDCGREAARELHTVGGAMIEALERRGFKRLGGWLETGKELNCRQAEAMSEKKPALREERRARRMSVEPGRRPGRDYPPCGGAIPDRIVGEGRRGV